MTDLAPAAPLGGEPSLSPADTALYATTVLVWGLSWYALKLQLGTAAPEVSVFWRFVLAAAIMMGWAVMRGAPLRWERSHALCGGVARGETPQRATGGGRGTAGAVALHECSSSALVNAKNGSLGGLASVSRHAS